MKVEINGRTLELVQGDITRQQKDAIVNAANSGLRGGGGVDGAIHSAGGPEIMAECRQLGGCPTGSACVTAAGRLEAKYVIHAVAPIWSGGQMGEPDLLRGAYSRSLEIAREKKLTSIAFPSLGTGAYRYPLDQAALIALSTVIDHLEGDTTIREAAFVLFNQEAYDAFERTLLRLTDKKPVAAGKSSIDLVDSDKVFAELRLSESPVLIDVASGAGNYALPAATAMQGKGAVHAFDLWTEGVEVLNRRIQDHGLQNISAAVADVSQKIPMDDDSADVCLIATALHDLAEEDAAGGTLREVARVLRPGGRLVVVEFKKREGPPGPPKRIRLSPEELDNLVLPFGFKKEHTVDTGAYTYSSVYTLG